MRRARIAITFTAILMICVGAVLVASDEADGHVITNTACAERALEMTRQEPPATRAEFQLRYYVCRSVGARHNAWHLAVCKSTTSAYVAITCTWPPYLVQSAWSLAMCESTAHDPSPYPNHGIYARNGEHVGLFQMGDGERSAHGWYVVGSSAYVQSAAGYDLYRSRRFGPWIGHGCM